MKPRVVSIILFVSAVFYATGVCMASAENPNVGNSFGGLNSTVPSQGQQRRLLTSPNPLDATSNDVVTGNVGGLRYFHGVVPYGSQYYNSAGLSDSGTTSVDSFLRYSTNPVLSDRNPAQTRVFFEPRRTVSSFYVRNGQRTALSESIATGKSRLSTSPLSLPSLTEKALQTETVQRPLSSNNQELDEILSRQFELKEKAKESTRKAFLESQDKFKNFFEIALEPESVEKPEIEKPITEQSLQELLQEPTLEPEQPEKQPSEILEPEQPGEILEPPIKGETEGQVQSQIEDELNLPAQLPIQQNFPVTAPKTESGIGETQAPEDGISMKDIKERADQHAEAERIRGEHPTIESLAASKFSDYMRAAEEFMRNGKFYKAADTYALAAVWMPNDPRPCLGQAFALFAAGEYMSSAFYLSRAIEMDPTIAEKKYDPAELIGDRDVFENRLIEMATWQQRSNSGELAFLMAYVLYQDGKTTRAAGSIQRAEEKMPDNKAISILKDVIIPEKRTAP